MKVKSKNKSTFPDKADVSPKSPNTAKIVSLLGSTKITIVGSFTGKTYVFQNGVPVEVDIEYVPDILSTESKHPGCCRGDQTRKYFTQI